MPTLYDISFTTQAFVVKYDDKGKECGRTNMDNPVTMTLLPHSTAMSYSNCDNFKMTQSVMSGGKRTGTSGKHKWGAPATKSAERDKYAKVAKDKTRKTKVKSAPQQSSVQKAAVTGDLGAAIND